MEKSAEMLIGTPVEIPVVPGNSERNTGKISGETLAANPKKKPPYGSLAETPEEIQNKTPTNCRTTVKKKLLINSSKNSGKNRGKNSVIN